MPDDWGRPVYKVDRFPRCRGKAKNGQQCNKLLAEFIARPWRIACPRCKCVNESFPEPGESPVLEREGDKRPRVTWDS